MCGGVGVGRGHLLQPLWRGVFGLGLFCARLPDKTQDHFGLDQVLTLTLAIVALA